MADSNEVRLTRKPAPTLEELDVMFSMLATIVDKLYERIENQEERTRALLDSLDRRISSLERSSRSR